MAHVPNSGRMRELLCPGARVLLAGRSGPRKTAFDLLMAYDGDRLVSIDSRLPPLLLEEALLAGRLPELGLVRGVRREVVSGESRLDLMLDGESGPVFVEAKSITLVRGGVAMFPDAPTTRGVRHLEELERLFERGYGAAAAFVIQRDDADTFTPYVEADPLFAATLAAVHSRVALLAYCCRVSPGEIVLGRRVPVVLPRT